MSLAMEKQMGFQDFSNKQFLKFKVSQPSHFEQIFNQNSISAAIMAPRQMIAHHNKRMGLPVGGS